jgi:cysteine desulfurase
MIMDAAPIYLDYNATTPVDPAVLDAMLPYLRTEFGNPSSQHRYGQEVRAAIIQARSEVARLIGAQLDEILFTSGGTESTNHALKGAAMAALDRGERAHRQVVVSAIEHPATLEAASALKRFGVAVRTIGVDRHGVLDLNELSSVLREPTLLVSLMHANNETGTLQPIAKAATLVRAAGALLHVDAAQSAGKVRVDVGALGADLLTLAGHKLYAPKGVGALFIRRGVELQPLIHGAGQEGGRRAGTENVPYMVALGAACRIAQESLATSAQRMQSLRDRLWTNLRKNLGERALLNGHPGSCLPNTLNVSFIGAVGAELLAALPQIAASTGSACHDGRVTISPVLQAMGIDPDVARGAVRFSLGRHSSQADVDRAAAIVTEYLARVPQT